MKRGLKRTLWVSAMLLVGLVALFVWRPWVPSEPVYQGKKLSAWVEQFQDNEVSLPLSGNRPTPKPLVEAMGAIRQVGTNGIPFLLRLLSTEEPTFKPWLRARAPDSWHELLGLENHGAKNKEIGATGLTVLGTNAGAAVPSLMKLLSAEMNENSPARFEGSWPVYILGFLEAAADPALPLLIRCLTNQNDSIRSTAVGSLGQLQRKPEIVVPALLAYLDAQMSKDIPTSLCAIESIEMFGTNASLAAPALTALLTDPSPHLRQAATNALVGVDPASAERAGIRIERRR